MYLAPLRVSYRPGELLYSWISREAIALGLPNANSFFHAFGWEEIKYHRLVRYNDAEYSEYCDLMGLSILHKLKIFRESSVYTGMAPFMSRAEQLGYINSVFLRSPPWDAYRLDPRPMYTDLKFCPACMQDNIRDFGSISFYTNHQLPGLCICPRHQIPLRVCKSPLGKEFKLYMENSEELPPNAPPNIMAAYAWFITRIFASGADVSIDEIRELVSRRIKDFGYYDPGGNYQKLSDEMQQMGYASLMSHPICSVIDNLHQLSRANQVDLIVLLLFLFRNANSFLSALPPSDNKSFKKYAEASGYTIISEVKGPLLAFRHNKCGSSFLNSAYGFKSGFRCPVCGITSEQEILESILSADKEGYLLTGSFSGLQVPTSIKHSCGNEYMITPYAYLYRGTRCTCYQQYSMHDLRQKISAYGYYTVISKNGPIITLQHNTCGKLFDCNWYAFIQHPYCRRCGATNFRQVKSFVKILPPSKLIKDQSGRLNSSGLYWQILSDYKENDIICLKDFKASGYSEKSISNRLSDLVKQKILAMLRKGIYCFGGHEPEDDLLTRFTHHNGNIIGYPAMASFAYSIGLLQKKPANTFIASNISTGRYNSCKVSEKLTFVIHPRAPVTNENWKVLQLLDILAHLPMYSDLPYQDTLIILHHYMTISRITFLDANPYLHLYRKNTLSRLKEIKNTASP